MQQSWAVPWVSETTHDRPLGNGRPGQARPGQGRAGQGRPCGKFMELFGRTVTFYTPLGADFL